ncbi:MAG: flippase-like domain-containing protein, partial [Thermoguttaceae bacterium]|nr:flippase-like domain-containing protein [Thermoguttaceae bacterium]
MKKALVFIVKLIFIVGLFAYLIYRAAPGSAFSELSSRAVNANYLAIGFLFNLAATVITIIRWRALVRALGDPLPTSDALKYGFIGFMFNLSPIGI